MISFLLLYGVEFWETSRRYCYRYNNTNNTLGFQKQLLNTKTGICEVDNEN